MNHALYRLVHVALALAVLMASSHCLAEAPTPTPPVAPSTTGETAAGTAVAEGSADGAAADGAATSTEAPAAESPATVCAHWHETAQVERLEGDLLSAREALLACSQEECPSFVQTDCVHWLEEVSAEIPTVVLEALGDDGLIADVEVRLGGRVLAHALDGRPIEVPVGLSEFTFTRRTGQQKTLRVLLRPGETNRIVSADFRTPRPAPMATTPTSDSATSVAPTFARPIPASVWLFGTAALLATATGITTGTIAKVKENNAGATCAPNCTDAVVAEIKGFALAADVAFGVAIGAGVTTAVLFLTRPSVRMPGTSASTGQPRSSSQAATVAPVLLAGPNAAWIGVRGHLR